MDIEVIFMGTGTSQGVPMIGCECEVCRSLDRRDKRLRSSVLIKVGDLNVVIDTTPDFRCQILRTGIKHLDAVLYTHEHKDHTGGMDDLRAFNYWMGRPVDIYCESRVERILRKDYDYAFAESPYPGVPEVVIHNIDEKPFSVQGLDIIPIRGQHLKLPVLGFRIQGFCYLTDMNAIEDGEIEKIKGVDVLVVNALRYKRHISHFNLEEALSVIERVKPKRAYLTHISHQLGLYEDIVRILPEGIEPATDGMVIKLLTL